MQVPNITGMVPTPRVGGWLGVLPLTFVCPQDDSQSLLGLFCIRHSVNIDLLVCCTDQLV